MAIPIADAFVQVKPELDGFGDALKKGIASEINKLKGTLKKVPIEVEVDKKSIEQVRKQLKDIKDITVAVDPKISPDAASKVREQIRETVSGVDVFVQPRADPTAVSNVRAQIRSEVSGVAASVRPFVAPENVAAVREQIEALATGQEVLIKPVASPAALSALEAQLHALGVDVPVQPVLVPGAKKSLTDALGVLTAKVRLTLAAADKKKFITSIGTIPVPVSLTLPGKEKTKLTAAIKAIPAVVNVTPVVPDARKAALATEIAALATTLPLAVTPVAAKNVAAATADLPTSIPVTADTSTFAATLRAGVATAIASLKPPPTVTVAAKLLAASKTALRTEIKAIKAEMPVKPIVSAADKKRIKAELGESGAVPIKPVASKTPVAAASPVPVRPDFTGFLTALQTGVTAAASKVKASVGVTLRIAAGEREKLRGQIAAITGATVGVKPVLSAEGKRTLVAEASAAAKTPASTPRKATGATGGVAEKAAEGEASAALKKLLEQETGIKFVLAEANKQLAAETVELTTLELTQQQVKKQLSAAATAEVKAMALGNQELAQRIALQKQELIEAQTGLVQRRGALDTTLGPAVGEGATTARSAMAKEVTQLSPAVDKLLAAEKELVAVESAAVTTTTALSGARKTADAAVRAHTFSLEALQAAERTGNAVLIENAQTLVASTEKRRKSALADLDAADAQAAAQRKAALGTREHNAAVDGLIASERSLAGIEKAGATAASTIGRLRRQATVATAAQAVADEAVVAARASGNAFLLAETESLAENIAVKRVAIGESIRLAEAEIAEARASSISATQHRGVGKGLGATVLSMIGLRGATLAASAPFLIGAASAAIFFKSVKQFSDLESTLNVFRATTGATAEQLEAAAQAARTLGADLTLPGVTGRDAADAMSQLARAGLEVEQAIAATRGVLELATAADIDNAQATTLVANALNAFSLAGEEASHVVDVLANAANAAQGEITDFGDAMSQVSAVASQAGVTFEDTTALLTLLARAGLRGSDAGTSLRTALLRLQAPAEEARNILGSLGLEVRDLSGNIRPEIFADFAKATADLSPNLRDAFASAVFGQDAIRAALLAGRQGVEGLRQVQQDLDRVGTGAELAAARTEGLAGAFQNIANQAATTGGEIGRLLAPAAQSAAEGIASALAGIGSAVRAVNPLVSTTARAIADLVSVIGGIGPILAAVAAYKSFGLAAALVARVVGPLTTAMAALKTAFAATAVTSGVASQLGVITTGSAVARTGIASLGSSLVAFAGGAANIAAIALAATAAAVVYFATRASDAEKAVKRLGEAVQTASGVLQGYRSAVDALNAAQAALPTQKLAVESANLAVAQASAAIAASNAAEGSVERRSLELDLANAIDQLRQAQETYNATLNQLPALESAVNQQRQDQIRVLAGIRAETEKTREELAKSASDLAAVGFDRLSEGALSSQAFTRQVRDLAIEQTDLAPILRENLGLLADFTERVRRTPTDTEIEFILNNEDFDKSVDEIIDTLLLGIRDARATAENTGIETGKALVGGFFETLENAKALGEQLVAALVRLETLGGSEATGELADTARAEIDRLKAELGKLGGEGAFVLRQAGKLLVPAMADSLRAAVAEFANVDDLVKKEVPQPILTLIKQLAAQGPRGKAELRKLGKDLMESFADGIDDAEERITESVENAKSNLVSLGESLASQVGQLIDAGPLGKQIERLQNALSARQVRQQRLGLVEQLQEAKNAVKEAATEVGPLARELEQLEAQLERIRSIGEKTDLGRALRDAREALDRARASLNIAPANASQEKAQARFLRPLAEGVELAERNIKQANLERRIESIGDQIEAEKKALQLDPLVLARKRVKDLEQQIRDFDDEQLIASLRKTADAQKQTAIDGINNVIAAFNTGGISLAQAQERIAKLVGSKVRPWQKAGFELGEAFGLRFQESAMALITQMEEIVLGPQVPGTTGVTPNVNRTREEQADILKTIKDQELLRTQIQTAIANAINKGPQSTNGLLKSIDKKLAGRTKTITGLGDPGKGSP